MTARIDLPVWRCHKLVRGFKIAQMVPLEGTSQLRLIDETGVYIVDVSNQYVMRYQPSVGDYYALYEDGYESLSPADAWEKGYTLLGSEDIPVISEDDIRRIFLESGFKLKEQSDGRTDLNDYVYKAARSLLQFAKELIAKR